MNWTLPSLRGGSLEITLTVPLRKIEQNIREKYNIYLNAKMHNYYILIFLNAEMHTVCLVLRVMYLWHNKWIFECILYIKIINL